MLLELSVCLRLFDLGSLERYSVFNRNEAKWNSIKTRIMLLEQQYFFLWARNIKNGFHVGKEKESFYKTVYIMY